VARAQIHFSSWQHEDPLVPLSIVVKRAVIAVFRERLGRIDPFDGQGTNCSPPSHGAGAEVLSVACTEVYR